MKISKKDALSWFEFFAQLPAGEQLLVKQQEIVYATFAQMKNFLMGAVHVCWAAG